MPAKLFLLIIALFTCGLMAGGGTTDPEKVQGPDACGECHKDEVVVWKETHHAKGFYETHRSDEALAILEKLGSKRGMRRDKDCKSCHYTTMIPEGKKRAKPSFGTSCESCHGAARDWIDIHNDYGGKDVKREQETPEHKKMRLEKSIAGGMIHPSDIYQVAANCFSCHTVPNERIVNQGGHTAGSEFNLVSWSQGEIRHNFFSSDSGKDNLPASPERKRELLLVGAILDVEYSLRSLAVATEDGTFSQSMAKRTNEALARLEKLQGAVNHAEVGKIIALAKGAKLAHGNQAGLEQVAGEISAIAQGLSKNLKDLSALDSHLPAESEYKGKPFK